MVLSFQGGCCLRLQAVFDTTWHIGLLYKLSKFELWNSLTKLIGSFLPQRKLRDSVVGEMFKLREMQAKVLHGSVLSPTLYNLYINMPP
jgi:hypothetical protein